MSPAWNPKPPLTPEKRATGRREEREREFDGGIGDGSLGCNERTSATGTCIEERARNEGGGGICTYQISNQSKEQPSMRERERALMHTAFQLNRRFTSPKS